MNSNMGAIENLSGLFGGGSGSNNPVGTAMPATGQNQWGSYPNIPGIVPPSGGGFSPTSGATFNLASDPNINGAPWAAGGGNKVATNVYSIPTFDPNFTNLFYQYLQSQLGQGVTPFNLSSALPSGGASGPGQLTAPLNPVMQQLEQFYSKGGSIDQTPAWQSMVASQGQNIAQNEANLREQFAFGGALGGSEFGTAISNYMDQTTKDQNALLGQMTAAAEENAANRSLSFGSELQTLDQNSINALYQEFIRTQPQYNPLMQMFGTGALSSPGTTQGGPKSSILGGIASLIPGLAGGASAGLASAGAGAGGIGAILAGLSAI